MSVTGTVYLIRAGTTNRYKVGFTSKTPEERRASLQTGNPETLEVVMSWVGSPDDERRLHGLLEPFRLEGEWFELDVPTLVTLLAKHDYDSQTAETCAEPAIMSNNKVFEKVKKDVLTHYLDDPMSDQDGGKVQVSEHMKVLLQMGVFQGMELWKWYDIDELYRIVPFERGERYGTEYCFDMCCKCGWIQENDAGQYRIDPNLDQSGYEFLSELADV